MTFEHWTICNPITIDCGDLTSGVSSPMRANITLQSQAQEHRFYGLIFTDTTCTCTGSCDHPTPPTLFRVDKYLMHNAAGNLEEVFPETDVVILGPHDAIYFDVVADFSTPPVINALRPGVIYTSIVRAQAHYVDQTIIETSGWLGDAEVTFVWNGAYFVIEDGPPDTWWMSPDITVDPVPPSVGVPSDIIARVHNVGNAGEDTTMKFWWASPNTGILHAAATHLGSEVVHVSDGATMDVTLSNPWTPSTSQEGHGCLLVEVFSVSDPLPTWTDDRFHAGVDRHVAQRNVTVTVQKSGKSESSLTFEAQHDGDSKDKEITIDVEKVPFKKIEPRFMKGLEKRFRRSVRNITGMGLVLSERGKEKSMKKSKGLGLVKLKHKAKPGQKVKMDLVFQTKGDIRPDEVAVFHIRQYTGSILSGGITVLLTGDERKGKK